MATSESSVNNFFIGNGSGNPYTDGGSSNPFAGGGSPLTDEAINNLFPASENPFTNGSLITTGDPTNLFTGGESAFTANQDTGSNNATIGTGNQDLSSNNATIGNGNWNLDSASYNSTIGNGNWLRDEASYNTTVGNGNWYSDSSSENSTLGNGNWSFGTDNSTIGNGNWDFGSNNVIIGNGNWLFTDNNVVIGNGNWFLSDDATSSVPSQNTQELVTLFPEVKSDVDSLIASITGKFGEEFTVLTGGLDPAAMQTYNQLILAQGDGTGLSTFSDSDLSNLFTSLNGLAATNESGGSPSCFFGCTDGGSPVAGEPVPEPSSALSLLALGLVYFVWAKKSKAKAKLS
jgi:PEP-CTERM motif